MFKIIHVAKLLGNNTNGIDYVVNELLASQRKIEGVIVDKINTSTFEFNIKNLLSSNIVVFHSIFCLKSWLLMIVCNLYKIPYVVFPHSGLTRQSLSKSKFKKKFVFGLFLRRLIRNASSVHFLNQEELSNSVSYHSHCFILPNGVSIISSDKYVGDREKYIAFMGRYDINHKGIDLLLEAVDLLQDEFRRLGFSIKMHGIDSLGQDLLSIRNFISTRNIKDIVSVGDGIYCNDAKVSFIGRASAYVLTSRYEGLPITVLEALALDTPCLVTRSTNVGNLIQENNFGLCCDTNVTSICEMFMTFFNKNNSIRFSKSKMFVLENYSWDNIGAQLVSQYEEVISNEF